MSNNFIEIARKRRKIALGKIQGKILDRSLNLALRQQLSSNPFPPVETVLETFNRNRHTTAFG